MVSNKTIQYIAMLIDAGLSIEAVASHTRLTKVEISTIIISNYWRNVYDKES